MLGRPPEYECIGFLTKIIIKKNYFLKYAASFLFTDTDNFGHDTYKDAREIA